MTPRRWMWVAALCAALSGWTAWSLGAHVAGGADSYGYVSQADAWLTGDLIDRDPYLDSHPPPMGRWALPPLGWRPSDAEANAMVPVYSAGYPMVLAVAKRLGGQPAMFAVTPMAAALLVWMTFVLGMRVGLPPGGAAAAAWLVASSPVVLHMSMLPMSDVPTAAAWLAVAVLVTGVGRRRAFAAGAVAGLAILLRPNLVPLAFLIGGALAVNDVRAGWRRVATGRAALFLLPAALGAAVNGVINAWWYGSPWVSGYGPLSVYYALDHVVPNLRSFGRWFVESQTPVALCGVAALLVFAVRRGGVWRVAAIAVTLLVAIYAPYLEFDAWWYLRFLLPAWPVLAAAGVSSAVPWWHRGGWRRGFLAVAVLGMAVHAAYFAVTRDVFRLGLTESRYAYVAKSAAAVMPPNAAVIAMQHSGTMRYYGGRMTARWDTIDAGDFHALMSWLTTGGRSVYFLLDRFEVDQVRRKFSAEDPLAALDWTPTLTFFGGETLLFDPAHAGHLGATTVLGQYSRRTAAPAPKPRW